MDEPAILSRLLTLHASIRDQVRHRLAHGALSRGDDPAEGEARVAKGEESDGDVSFAIDVPAEQAVLEMAEAWGQEQPLVVVCEGIGERRIGRPPRDGETTLRLIADPIDGTRNLMNDMRSGWVLSAVAIDRGDETTIDDVIVAVQSEIPVRDRRSADILYAIRGMGAMRRRVDLETGWVSDEAPISASNDPRLDNGFHVFFKFSPEDRMPLARIEEAFLREMVATHGCDRRTIYDDQYISNAGQLYLLLTRRYRFCADLRGYVGDLLGIDNFTSQPYDMCCALIAEEAGIPLTDPRGGKLSFPLRIKDRVNFVGYANEAVRALLEPILLRQLAAFERRAGGGGA